MTAAKLPVIKDLSGFVFEGTKINEELGAPTPQLHGPSFLPNRLNVVLAGGDHHVQEPSSRRHHLRRSAYRARGRYFNAVDFMNRRKEEARLGKAGNMANRYVAGRLQTAAPKGSISDADGGQLWMPCDTSDDMVDAAAMMFTLTAELAALVVR
jgi:hypothetical protein